MQAMAYFDGKIVEFNEPAAAVEDRGYQFGDGIYEATQVYNGKCFALDRHIDRCIYSLRQLKIPIVLSGQDIKELHEELIAASGVTDGNVYFQITRSTAPRDHRFPQPMIPHISMTIRPMPVPEDMQQSGVSCITTEDIRWLRCDVKSLNLLGNVLAKQQAHEAGCQEAILVRKDSNHVTECASSNLFIVKDDIIWTHPLGNLILKGVTRSIVVEELLPQFDYNLIEKPFTPEFMQKADEVFITNTLFEVMPVTAIDRKQVGDGQIGAVTKQLQSSYKKLVVAQCG